MEEEKQQGVQDAPKQETVPEPPKHEESSNAWIAYLLGWLTGLIIFFTKKDDFHKFHAMQSIIVFGGLHILYMLFWRMFWYSPIWTLIQLASFVLWIFLMVKAHAGEKYKLPYVGDLAEKWAK